MAHPALPMYVVLQSKSNMKYLAVAEDADGDNKYGGSCSSLGATGDQVQSPLSKFNLEKAKTKKGFFNIRSCYNNKYVVMEDAADSSSSVVAEAAEPNEDPSQSSSTLVEVVVHAAGDVKSVQFRLVYNRKFLAVKEGVSKEEPSLYVGGGDEIGGPETQFTVINWESLMILPEYVVLKGDNGKYLRTCTQDIHAYYTEFLKYAVTGAVITLGLLTQLMAKGDNGRYHFGYCKSGSWLQFDGSDIGDLSLVHQVLPVGDGTIMMKPMLQPLPSTLHWHKRVSGERIGIGYQPSRFMPVKAGSNSIALRFMDNDNQFCRIHTSGMYTDNLVADSESITKESRFIVEEPLLSRDIFDLEFRLRHARIYDQDVITMITRDATNNSSTAETMELRLMYTDTSTRTWDCSLGLKLGFSAKMKAGAPLIAEGEVTLSAEFQGSYKWGDKQQTSTQTETIHTVTVPPKTRVKARLLATRGKCDVPFSCTQRDVLVDGQEFLRHVDGIYTGANTYNFKFEKTEEKLI